MKLLGRCACLLFTLLIAPVSGAQQGRAAPHKSPVSLKSPEPASNPDYRTLINRYCVVCHNETAKIGGLELDKADLSKIPEQADVWEKVERKLRSGMMPPIGMPHPTPAQVDGFASMLETKLDAAVLAKPDPGPALLRRMTRTEYGNAVRDLIGLNVDIA